MDTHPLRLGITSVREKASYRKGEWVWVHSHGKWRAKPVTQVVKTGYYCVGESTNPKGWDELFAVHPETGARPTPEKKRR